MLFFLVVHVSTQLNKQTASSFGNQTTQTPLLLSSRHDRGAVMVQCTLKGFCDWQRSNHAHILHPLVQRVVKKTFMVFD